MLKLASGSCDNLQIASGAGGEQANSALWQQQSGSGGGASMPLLATILLPGGLSMPTVGLGTFKSRGQEVTAAVSAALEEGVRHIDTASVYKVRPWPAVPCCAALSTAGPSGPPRIRV